MVKRGTKALFYSLAGPAMKLNGAAYRALRAPRAGTVKVHLGPGQKKYLDGWVNVDANFISAKCDVWADLRNSLPFRDGTVDALYSHHVIEHLPDPWFHLREVHRVLKPGGVIRIGGPNGDSAMHKFVANDHAWFEDYPDSRKSIGGRLENFIYCRCEHLTILTASYLTEIAEAVGFGEVAVRKPIRETGYPQWFDANLLGKEFESDFEWPHTLIIEAVKK